MSKTYIRTSDIFNIEDAKKRMICFNFCHELESRGKHFKNIREKNILLYEKNKQFFQKKRRTDMKETRRNISVAMNSIDRSAMELKSVMNHGNVNPDVMAKINEMYANLCDMLDTLNEVEEEL